MIVLVHKAVPQLLPFRGRPIGRLISPRGGFGAQATHDAGLRWACDNDAFSGFHEARYRRMLDAVYGIPGCLFVTLPDVVEDAAATLELADLWLPELEARGLPPALVSQDGLAAGDVPWDRLRALFVGGSTDWKYAEESVAVVREAQRRGLWVHFGRVNTMRRATWAPGARRRLLRRDELLDVHGREATADARPPRAARANHDAQGGGMKQAQVALFSGGLDSAVMVAQAIADGYDVHPLFFDYGQLHSVAENNAAIRVARHYRLALEAVDVPRRIFTGSGSALLGESEMPRDAEDGISAAYVPGRNAVLISLAATYAVTIGATAVLFGATAGDAEHFPDCRPEFVEAMEWVVQAGTGGAVALFAPFIQRSKAEVVALGLELDVPLELTVSCYRGTDCGACPACVARTRALIGAEALV